MLKHSITYIDYDGNERTEDLFFNLSKAELTELELSEIGGYDKFLERVVAAQDSKQIYSIFKEIVLSAYGEKSLDGKRFIKKKLVDGQTIRLRDEFEQTEAFSEFMMYLLQDENAAAEFANKVVPAEISEQSTSKIPAPSKK